MAELVPNEGRTPDHVIEAVTKSPPVDPSLEDRVARALTEAWFTQHAAPGPSNPRAPSGKDIAALAPAVIEALAARSDEVVVTLTRELESLADLAARVVTEPRRFLENEDELQQRLGQQVASARAKLSTALDREET